MRANMVRRGQTPQWVYTHGVAPMQQVSWGGTDTCASVRARPWEGINVSRPSTWSSRGWHLLLAAALFFGLLGALPSTALAEANDTLPGVAAPDSPIEGAVDASGDVCDVYRFHLEEGQILSLSAPALSSSATIELRLLRPGATDLNDAVHRITWGQISQIGFFLWDRLVPEGEAGDHYLSVAALSGDATYTISWSVITPSFSLDSTGTEIELVKGRPPVVCYCQANWGLLGSNGSTLRPYQRFTASTTQPWLSINPTQDWARSYEQQQFAITADASSLQPGAYDATATVRYFGAAPQPFRVTLEVLDQPTISVNAANLHVKYGTKVALNSALRDSGGGLIPGRQVALQESFNGSTWTTVTAPTSLTGSYSVVRPIYRKTYFRWVFRGAPDLAPCTSARRLIESYAWVGQPNVPSHVHKNRTYTYIGYLKPRHTAGSTAVRVFVQTYYRGAWRDVASLGVGVVNYSSYSKYSYWERFKGRDLPRRWRVRARHADSDHLTTYSPWRNYSVY
jgi:hypothetical protein